VGVEENARAIEGVVGVFALGMVRGSRTDGIRDLRRIETAIVGCGRLDAGELEVAMSFRRFWQGSSAHVTATELYNAISSLSSKSLLFPSDQPYVSRPSRSHVNR
jgi:hypothetical protein